MPLQKQILHVPFGKGVDTKTDPKLVPNGTLTGLSNGVFTTAGIISKRNGYIQYSDLLRNTQTAIGAGDSLGLFNPASGPPGELLKFQGPSFYSYIPSDDAWINKGTVTPLVVQGEAQVKSVYQQTVPSAATIAGQTLFVWEDTQGGVRCKAVDDETGAVVLDNSLCKSTGTRPRAVAYGATIQIVYCDTANNLYGRIYTPGTGVLGAETTLATNIHGTPCLDLIPFNGNAIIVYRNTTPAISVAYILANTGAFAGVGSGFPVAVAVTGNALDCIAVLGSETYNQLWIGWHETTNGTLGAIVSSVDFSVLLAGTVVDATLTAAQNITGVLSSANPPVATWYYEITAAATYNYLIRTNTLTYAGVAGTSAVFLRSVGLAAKAFTYGTGTFIPVAFDSTLQATYFLVNSSGGMVARILPQQAGGITARKSSLPPVLTSSTGIYRFPDLIKFKLVSETGQVYQQKGVWQTILDFTPANQHYNAQIGLNLHIAGGQLYDYDGVGPVEHGFAYYPENYTNSTGGGGSIADGTYQYVVVYEWVDAQGQLHQSTTGVPLTVVVSGGAGVATNTLTIPTLRLTAKVAPRPVSIAVYRTQSNLTTFYRVSSIGSPTLNVTTSDTVSFADTLADASIAANALLYTTGDVLDKDTPPAASLLTASKTRLFLAGMEQPYQIWYSFAFVKDQGVAFNQAFVIQLAPDGGVETALAVMDERLIIFRANRIEYVAGGGPSATGQNLDGNPFQLPPILITTDVGCTNPNSIAVTPSGLMFQSAKGIYLLGRDLTVNYIGAPVEAYNSSSVTSADLIGYTNQVRCLTDAGVALTYDYFFGQWSVFTNHGGLDALIWDGNYCYLRDDGKVWQETVGVYSDNGSHIPLVIKTAWLHLGALQAYQRCYRAIFLGSFLGSHLMTVNVFYDNKDFPSQTVLIDPENALPQEAWGDDAVWGEVGTVWGSVDDGVYQFTVYMLQQQCEAIQFQFEDSMIPSGSPNAGYTLAGLDILAGMQQGLMRQGPSKLAG